MRGKTIGSRYEIIEKVGEGGMGVVYRARDRVLQREVAIKMLHPNLCSELKIKTRFHIEAVVTAGLDHPSIVTLYDFLSEGDQHYIVMQFLTGKTGEDLVRTQGAIPCQQLIPIMCDVIDGLAYAHRKGIIHRDIKPNNIMVTTSGQIKIMDFGIARVMNTPHLTQTCLTPGSVLYMSPEQIKNEEVDRRSDIYSLGITLFHMATGKAPFYAPNLSQYEILRRHVSAELPSPRALNPEIPAYIEKVIQKATMKRPEDRYQSMEEVQSALTSSPCGPTRIHSRAPEGLDGQEDAGYRPRTFPPVEPPPKSGLPDVFRRKESLVLISILAVSIVLVVAAVAWQLLKHEPDRTSAPFEAPRALSEPEPSPHPPLVAPAQEAVNFKAYYITKEKGELELKDAETLTVEDRYYVTFAPENDVYIYMAQIDSAGSIAPIFPNAEFSSRGNPLQGHVRYRLPENKYFYLGGDPGEERLYVIVSKAPNEEIEQIYSELRSADKAKVKLLTLQFRKIFDDQPTNNAKELWFWHK